MDDANGTPTGLRRLKEMYVRTTDSLDKKILTDLSEDSPDLRTFLLGNSDTDNFRFAGRISVSRGPRSIRVRLSVPQLGLEAHYEFLSWCEIWETIDNDLSCNSVPWQDDYRTRTKAERDLLKS